MSTQIRFGLPSDFQYLISVDRISTLDLDLGAQSPGSASSATHRGPLVSPSLTLIVNSFVLSYTFELCSALLYSTLSFLLKKIYEREVSATPRLHHFL